MATPVTFPSIKRAVGWAKETTQGTQVLPLVAAMPIDEFVPEDIPTWLDDKAGRNSMVDMYGRIQGPLRSEWTMQGPIFLDMFPYLLNNILGDITTTGAAPNSHAISLLNSGGGQPGSLTIVHWQGPPTATNARYYPGSCLSELTITGNTESDLLRFSAKGTSWVSADVPTTPPTFTYSTVQAMAPWRFLLGVGGPASGGTLVPNLREWSITISRALRVENTAQNSQNPYIIQRGELAVTAALTYVAVKDEALVAPLLTNSQPQLQLIADTGAGATNFGITVDMLVGAYDTAKINMSEEAVGYDVTVKAVPNTTNAGGSGGYSPIKVTVRNQTAAGTY